MTAILIWSNNFYYGIEVVTPIKNI